MKAVLFPRYGSPDVLQLAEIQKPTPRDHEVLVRIHATTVTMGDCEIRSFKVPLFLWLPMRLWLGVRRPRKQILGQELAGEIEAAGKDVKHFKIGDKIFATSGMNLSAHAEYTCLPENPGSEAGAFAIKPANMTYDEAAAVPVGGLVALRFLRQAHIQRGEKILINGAGGSIGTFAIQLAKYFGAEVTAVDSTQKLQKLRAIGADHVIDYTRDDFTKRSETYDVIFDVVGKSSFSHSLRLLNANGRYLLANPRLSHIIRGLWVSRTNDKKVILGIGNDTVEDLLFLKELIEAGKLKTIIDRRYPLEQISEAHRYVENGLKTGHVIITLAHI
jgi:NADPH:quinone reductase-like Zn-dependent oxidoreductase